MDFSDSKHRMVEVSIHHTTELDVEETCRPEILERVDQWRARPDHSESGASMLRDDSCTSFSISYEGKSGDYWPTESKNDISESLVRDFLYHDGICSLTDERVRLFRLQYRVIAIDGDDHLLVCPYITKEKNISGIVVVSVNKVLR
jgi:hypothetical protein